MRAAGTILGGSSGGGEEVVPGETVYEDPTTAAAIAELAAGKWIRIQKSGQLPSAASTYADVLLLGTIPEGVAWAVEGRWNASFVSGSVLSAGTHVFRGSVGRATGANATNSDVDTTGISGTVSGQLVQFRLDTNAIYLQTRITAAQPYTYNINFRMCQLSQPV